MFSFWASRIIFGKGHINIEPKALASIAALSLLRVSLFVLDLMGVAAAAYLVASISSGRYPDTPGLDILPDGAISESTLLALGLLTAIFFLLKSILAPVIIASLARKLGTLESNVASTLGASTLADSRKWDSWEIGKLTFYLLDAVHARITMTALARVTILAELLMSAFLIVFVFTLDPMVAVVSIVYFATVFTFLNQLLRRMVKTNSKATRSSQEKLADSIKSLWELRVPIRLGGDYASWGFTRFQELRKNLASQRGTTFLLSAMPRFIFEAAAVIGIAMFLGVTIVVSDVASNGDIIGALAAAAFRISAGLLPLMAGFQNLARASESARGLSFDDVFPAPAGPAPRPVYLVESGPSDSSPTGTTVEIRFGEKVLITGDSGSGKTTLMRALAGLEAPLASQQRLSINGFPPGEILLGNGVAQFVSQKPRLVEGTLLENLGIFDEQIDDEVTELIKVFGLTGLFEEDRFSSESLPQVSVGQSQRLVIIRALLAKPKILFLDEPTSALDKITEQRVTKAILDNFRGTLFMVTHRPVDQAAFDWAARVDSGQVHFERFTHAQS